MREWKGLLTLWAILIIIGMTATLSSSAETEKRKSEVTIVNPGEATRCASDFIVQNIGKEVADLKVVLGNKVYIDTLLEPQERQAFSLPGTISMAQFHGREVPIDDVAVVINLGPKSKLKLNCITLKAYPSTGDDELKKFR